MGFEVELKFRVVDPADLVRRIIDLGGAGLSPVEHEDIYFAHPARDFATTGEALRIRGEGERSQVTYKGAKRSGPAKTREEIEVEFTPGLTHRTDLRAIFERLGFAAVATVRKQRASYHLLIANRAMTVTIDQTESLGIFAEVETLIANEPDLDAGQQAVLALAADLGLTDVEPKSYLRMLLESMSFNAGNPAGQT